MYERRKVLLGLIEAFGGELRRTDCLKLLFLLGQSGIGGEHYEFFPYLYGPFSHTAMLDKRRLTDSGHLRVAKDFVLADSQGYLALLRPRDRIGVQRLKSRIGPTNGRELLRQVYLDYPSYCSRSRILNDVLDECERVAASAFWSTDDSPCLFTIGYEGRTIDSFLRCVLDNNVRAIVDVRRNALSMKYGFSKRSLGHFLHKSGVRYLHMPNLGIPSRMRQALVDSASYARLFKAYRECLLPQESASLAELVREIRADGRVALVCFEAEPHLCHRHIIAEAVTTAMPNLALANL